MPSYAACRRETPGSEAALPHPAFLAEPAERITRPTAWADALAAGGYRVLAIGFPGSLRSSVVGVVALGLGPDLTEGVVVVEVHDMASRLDTSVPHPARRYNYWLGGKDNFAVDRESGDAVAALFPSIRTAVVENRYFLRRAVTLLAGELGIRQFLDIGTGLPTADNTHEVAQRVAPKSSVVYVDNDPLVMVHARALLTAAPGAGPTSYIEADVRSPEHILQEAAKLLDFSRPVGLMLIAVMHFIADEEDPYGIVRRLVAALPPGSYLALSHSTSDYLTPEAVGAFRAGPIPVYLRAREDVARFFDGLEVLDPGVESTSNWRAEDEPQPRPDESETATDCAVARIP
jgi:hypothetical protein